MPAAPQTTPQRNYCIARVANLVPLRDTRWSKRASDRRESSRIGPVSDEVRLVSGFVGLVGAFVDGARPLEPAGLGAGRTDPASTRAVIGVCAPQSLSHPGLGLDQGDQRVGHCWPDHRRRSGFPAGTTSVGATAIAAVVDQAKAVGRDWGMGVCCRGGSGRRGDDGLVGHWSIRPPAWRGDPHKCPTRTMVRVRSRPGSIADRTLRRPRRRCRSRPGAGRRVARWSGRGVRLPSCAGW